MKFAFVIRFFQQKNFHGGGEKLFSKLILGLINDNHQIDIYCSKSDTKECFGINKIIQIDEKYDHNKPESMEKFYEKAKFLINNENYDYVISENITPPIGMTFLQGHSLANRLKKLKTPIEAFLYNFRKIKKQRIKAQEKWLKQGYEKIFVPANILKQDLTDNFGINPDIIKIVYPGVDNKKFVKNIENIPEILTFGLSAPGFKIKGGYVFIDALKQLKKQKIDFNAKIIYPKHKKNLWLKFLVNIYGFKKNITFLPFQKDMSDFYNSIDCLVMPSLEDTFGLAAIEAMSYGKTCIISSFAGASEIIKDGENGFVFQMDKHGSDNLAKKMRFLIKNKKILIKTSQKALESANFYSWQRFYADFIKNLLE
ncbi:MAG: glycosyltransferase family 4 protein [Candidatus Gastranaerophilales bacterium]|nr:glycosyltransferase family 4 protein [Candidatus Gastranaerophilales bacterium]